MKELNVLQRVGLALMGKQKAEEVGLSLAIKEMGGQISVPNKLDQALYKWFGLNMVIWGADDQQAYVKSGYNINHNLFSVINYITSNASKGVPRVFRYGKDGKKEYIDNHPFLEVIRNPNQYQGYGEFIQEYLGFKLITGNSYIYGVSPETGENKGKARELHVLPAPLIRITSGGRFMPVGGYVIEYNAQDQVPFKPEEVMHSRYPNYDYEEGSELYGTSPLKAGWRLLNKDNANQEAMMKSFSNLGASGVLFNKGDKQWTEQQQQLVQRNYKKKIAGTDNKDRIIITSGDLGYINFGLSPADLMLVEDSVANLRAFCSLYQAPSELFNDKASSTFNNVKEAKKSFWTNAVMPHMDSLAEELTRWQLRKYEKDIYLEFDYSHIEELQEDLKDKATWLQAVTFMTPNEKRGKVNLDPIQGGDVLYIPANMIPIEDIGEAEQDQKHYLD